MSGHAALVDVPGSQRVAFWSTRPRDQLVRDEHEGLALDAQYARGQLSQREWVIRRIKLSSPRPVAVFMETPKPHGG